MDLQKTLNWLRASVEKIKAELTYTAIDGSPYLLICKVPGAKHPDGSTTTDFEVVYGCWDGVNSFKSLDLTPDTLVGTIQMSLDSLDKNIKQLQAGGFSDGTHPIEVYGRHWRAEYTRRLSNYAELIDAVEHLPPQAGHA